MMSLPVMDSTTTTPEDSTSRTAAPGRQTPTVNKRAVRILLECFLVMNTIGSKLNFNFFTNIV